ncbi:Tetratricopeptide repeat protein [Minicystis rosea]|nr:Tetratricopeptide repeat protein [Minicystis rosea]
MSRLLKLVSSCNIKALPLTPADAFLLSHVDAAASEHDLAQVTGFAPEQVAAMLDRLADLGAVELQRAIAFQARAEARSKAETSAAVGEIEEEEDIEIDTDRRRRIVDVYRRLDELSPHELLGIEAQASMKQIKSAYAATAAEFHPDRYFRKRLGSYRPKLEVIFTRLTRAYDTLIAERRAATDEEPAAETRRAGSMTTMPPPPASERRVMSSPARIPAPSAEDILALRRRTLARKLSGPRPAAKPELEMVVPEPGTEALHAYRAQADDDARRARLSQSLAQGKLAIDRRDYDSAIQAYRRVAALAPEDPEVQTTCQDAIRLAAGMLADGHWEQAVQDEREGRWEAAALAYAKVCAGRPNDARAHERVAHATLKLGNMRRAVEFARKAVEIAPGTALFHVTLARAYAAAGLGKSAQAELDRALALSPNDERIRQLVVRVRQLWRAGKLG